MRGPGKAEFRGTSRFEVIRRLGAGGMGIVYEAHDRAHGERVALKTLWEVDPDALLRLKNEFRVLQGVHHPNLIRLGELFEEAGRWFFTMELVPGCDFRAWVRGESPEAAAASSVRESVVRTLRAPVEDDATSIDGTTASTADPPRGAAFDVDRLRGALRQLARGLVALHDEGKLHRDIKPANVLVTAEGRVVLLDFGLVGEQQPRHADLVAGTPEFMAPEQAAGGAVSPASDWYSVGVMLYEALTGRLPHDGEVAKILVAKRHVDPPAPGKLVEGVPDDLGALCVDLLQRNPAARPTGRDVLRLLGEDLPEPMVLSGSGHVPLVLGRDEELRALASAFEETRAGRCVVVHVHGPSGVGKTALVSELLEGLRRRGAALVLAGRCYERESVPYKALDNLVDALSESLCDRPYPLVAPLLLPDVQALARLFPVLDRVWAISRAPKVSEGTDDHELRRRAFQVLRGLLARLAEQGPVVLHLDDLQWGDLDSAELLREVLRAPDPPPVLLIASYRTEDIEGSAFLQALREPLGPAGDEPPPYERGASRQGDRERAAVAPQSRGHAASGPLSRELVVGPLSPEVTAELAQALLGHGDERARAQARAIAREAEGSPLLVEELVRTLEVGAQAGPAVALEELLRARVERLALPARRLFQVIAVAGRPVEQGVALEAAALGPQGRAALDALRAAYLVRTRGPRDEDLVEPHHDRTREAVVARLDAEATRDLHARLARRLEATGRADPERLAVHFAGAGDDARAGAYALLAADRAAAALAFDRAARLYDVALASIRPEDPRRADVWTRLAEARVNAGRSAEAADAFREAARAAPPDRALELDRRAAEQLLHAGRIDDGLAELDRILVGLGMRMPRTPRSAVASLLLQRARLRLRGLGTRARPASAIPAPELSRVDTCWAIAIGLIQVDSVRGAGFQTRHLLLALDTGEPFRVTRALVAEAMYLAFPGDAATMRRAEQLLEEAATRARALGDPYLAGLCAAAEGTVAYQAGRFREARQSYERSTSILQRECRGVSWELCAARVVLATTLVSLGEIEALSQLLGPAVADARERGDRYALALLGLFEHLVSLAADDPERARRQTADAFAHWAQRGFDVPQLAALAAWTHIDLYDGRGADAAQRVAAHRADLASTLLLRVRLLRVLAAEISSRALLASAPLASDREPVLQAAERHAATLAGARVEHARALAELVRAAVATQRGDLARATALLGTSAERFDAAGVALLAAAARRRHGELTGGEHGRELVARADAVMHARGIVSPARLTRMWAPGFVPP